MNKKIEFEISTHKEARIKILRCAFCNKICHGHLQASFGYGSGYDTDIYEAGICDECFDKHLKNKLILTSNDFGVNLRFEAMDKE